MRSTFLQQQPFKLSIEAHGRKITLELDYSDINGEELSEVLFGFLVTAGWGHAIEGIAENLIEIRKEYNNASDREEHIG